MVTHDPEAAKRAERTLMFVEGKIKTARVINLSVKLWGARFEYGKRPPFPFLNILRIILQYIKKTVSSDISMNG